MSEVVLVTGALTRAAALSFINGLDVAILDPDIKHHNSSSLAPAEVNKSQPHMRWVLMKPTFE